jgi:membrane protein required for colicin V production
VHVSLLDLLLALILVTSMGAGFAAGFARVGIGFAAAVMGLLFGLWFYGIPAAWIHKYLHSSMAANLLGFFAVMFIFVLAGALIGKLLSKLFHWGGLTWLDRLLGAGFGLARGVLIGAVFVAVLLAFTPTPLPNWMVNSRMLPYAVDASNLCAALAPREVKDTFHEALGEIRKDWDEQVQKARHDLPGRRHMGFKKADP